MVYPRVSSLQVTFVRDGWKRCKRYPPFVHAGVIHVLFRGKLPRLRERLCNVGRLATLQLPRIYGDLGALHISQIIRTLGKLLRVKYQDASRSLA